jgi:hypothetical protein
MSGGLKRVTYATLPAEATVDHTYVSGRDPTPANVPHLLSLAGPLPMR